MLFFIYSSQEKNRELCMPNITFYHLVYICVFLAGKGKLLSGIVTFLLYHTHFKIQKSIFVFWCMYRAYCTVYYSDQHIHSIYVYINNILYIVSTPTCFDASASSSGSRILLLC